MPCYWIGEREREMRGRDARRGERLRARERRERTLDHKGVGECVRVFGVRPRVGRAPDTPRNPAAVLKIKTLAQRSIRSLPGGPPPPPRHPEAIAPAVDPPVPVYVLSSPPPPLFCRPTLHGTFEPQQ